MGCVFFVSGDFNDSWKGGGVGVCTVASSRDYCKALFLKGCV